MASNKLKVESTCSVCETKYDKKEVKRIYGKESSVLLTNCCSAKCYTEKTIK